MLLTSTYYNTNILLTLKGQLEPHTLQTFLDTCLDYPHFPCTPYPHLCLSYNCPSSNRMMTIKRIIIMIFCSSRNRSTRLHSDIPVKEVIIMVIVIRSLSRAWLFLTTWTTAHQAFPVLHYLPELAQTHVHWVSGTIQPSHPLPSPSPLAFSLSQHQGLFQWVDCLQQVVKVLELHLQHQSFQWIFKVDFLQDWLVYIMIMVADIHRVLTV